MTLFLPREGEGFEYAPKRVIGLDNEMDRIGDIHTFHYIQNLDGGKYKDKFPLKDGNYVQKRYETGALDPAAQQMGQEQPMLDQDIEDLKKFKPEISADLKQTVREAVDELDKMGEENFRNGYSTTLIKDENGKPRYVFKGEQAEKYYGFYPLVKAKRELANAIKAGDYAAAETALARYDDATLHLDRVMQLAGTGSAAFGGNVESIRAFGGANPDTRNAVPLKYLQDMTHNKVNGLFALYGYCKSNDQTVEEVLDDPVGSLSKAAAVFNRQAGISGKGSAGRRLARAFSPDYAEDYDYPFDNQLRGLGHALDAVACMSSDEKERERIYGLTQVANGVAVYEVRKEQCLMQSFAEADEEVRNLSYQHAALLPPEEFDLANIAKIVTDPNQNWKQRLDPDALIAKLRAEGKLDYSGMAARVDQIIADAEDQKNDLVQGNKQTNYKPEEFKWAAVKAFTKALLTATPEEKQSEGHKSLMNKVTGLKNGLRADTLKEEKIKAETDLLNDDIRTLGKRKKGFLLYMQAQQPCKVVLKI